MTLRTDRRVEHFEVHVRRGERWTIELTAAEEGLACERARELLQRAGIDGARVWKEVFDPQSGQAAGRLVLAETKAKPRPGWRFARWTAEPAAEPPPEPETHVRRGTALPPPLPADWPVAVCSLGGGCLALIALAVLAALGEWLPLG